MVLERAISSDIDVPSNAPVGTVSLDTTECTATGQ